MDVEHAGPRQPKVGRGRGLPRSGGPAFVDDRAPPIKADELVDPSLPTQWGGRPAREASPPGGDDQVAKCGTLTTSLISPPHAVGRSAGSRSEPAGWGRSGCQMRHAAMGPRARGACLRRSRLPTQWGGRPAREGSPPGGEDQVAKCGTLTTWLISPPHAVGRSAGSRSEPAGWGRSGCQVRKADDLVDVASPRSGEVGRLAKRARRVGTIRLPNATRCYGPPCTRGLPSSISPPRHAGRSAGSRSEPAGWGRSGCQVRNADDLVDLASPRSGEVGRLAKRARRVGTIRLPSATRCYGPPCTRGLPSSMSPPRHAGRSAGSRSEPAGWGRSGCQVRNADDIVDLASPRNGEVGRLAKRARRVWTDQVAKRGTLTTSLIWPPHAVGRSAGSRSEPAGWGRSGCQVRHAAMGPRARRACLRRSRLPATRGGRPAREASPPGGDDLVPISHRWRQTSRIPRCERRV